MTDEAIHIEDPDIETDGVDPDVNEHFKRLAGHDSWHALYGLSEGQADALGLHFQGERDFTPAPALTRSRGTTGPGGMALIDEPSPDDREALRVA